MPFVEMSGASVVSLYVCANLLLVGVAVLLAAIRALSAVFPRPLTYGHLLAVGRALALSALLLPPIAMWRGDGDLSPVRAQVWSAPSMHVGAESRVAPARVELQL